jgi:hypothetical protein
MSWEAVKQVMEESRSVDTDRLVLLAIAEAADKTTWDTWIGLDTIGRKAGGKSRSTVQRSIKKLVAMGELTVTLHGAPQPDRKPQWRSNLYRVVPATPAEASGVTAMTTLEAPSGVTAMTTLNGLVASSGGSSGVTRSTSSGVTAMTTYPSLEPSKKSSSSTNGNGHSAPPDEDDALFDLVATCLARLRFDRELRDGKIIDPRKRPGWIKATSANIIRDEEGDLRSLMRTHPDVTDALQLCELYEPDAPTGWQGAAKDARPCFADWCDEHNCPRPDCRHSHEHVSRWLFAHTANGQRVWFGTSTLLTDEQNAERDAYEAEMLALSLADDPL